MRVEVRPCNVNGLPLTTGQREALPPFMGELKVYDERPEALGRIVRCAKVLKLNSDAQESALPDLMDAQLLWADGQILRISGIETDDQGRLFAQTWVAWVLKC